MPIRATEITASIVLAVPLLVYGPAAHAQIMAVESTYNPAETYLSIPADSTYGWQFRVRETPISVTHLGFFDHGLDGLFDFHQVGIWDADGNAVAQETVPSGTQGILSGAYRFTLSDPVVLEANTTYYIGAHSLLQNDTAIFFASPQTYAEEISYLGATYSQLPGFAPADTPYDADHGVFGPNFQFIPVPEPHEYALITGILLAVFLGIRRAYSNRQATQPVST